MNNNNGFRVKTHSLDLRTGPKKPPKLPKQSVSKAAEISEPRITENKSDAK